MDLVAQLQALQQAQGAATQTLHVQQAQNPAALQPLPQFPTIPAVFQPMPSCAPGSQPGSVQLPAGNVFPIQMPVSQSFLAQVPSNIPMPLEPTPMLPVQVRDTAVSGRESCLPSQPASTQKRINLTKFLTDQSVREIYALRDECSAVELAERFRVTSKTVRSIWSGNNWSKVTGAVKRKARGEATKNPGLHSCSKCRMRKVKCDRGRPCQRCLERGCAADCYAPEDAEEAAKSISDEALPSPIQGEKGSELIVPIHRPVATPLCVSVEHSQRPVLVGTAENGILEKFVQFGFKMEEIQQVFRCLPARLQRSLVRVSDVIDSMGPPPPTAPKLPQHSFPKWNNSTSCCFLAKQFTPSGANVFVNPTWAKFTGLHHEEALARIISNDLKGTSQFREMVFFLELLLTQVEAASGKPPTLVKVQPMRKQHGTGGQEVVLTRCTFNAFGDGGTFTVVQITPEEFTRAVAAQARLRGRLTPCELSGEDLVAQEDLWGAETVPVMAQSEPGRRRLEDLAARVEEAFGLLPPPPGSR